MNALMWGWAGMSLQESVVALGCQPSEKMEIKSNHIQMAVQIFAGCAEPFPSQLGGTDGCLFDWFCVCLFVCCVCLFVVFVCCRTMDALSHYLTGLYRTWSDVWSFVYLVVVFVCLFVTEQWMRWAISFPAYIELGRTYSCFFIWLLCLFFCCNTIWVSLFRMRGAISGLYRTWWDVRSATPPSAALSTRGPSSCGALWVWNYWAFE